MPKKIDFDYTLEEFYRDVINDLKGESVEGEEKSTKPNLLETLKAKTGLNRIRNERQSS